MSLKDFSDKPTVTSEHTDFPRGRNEVYINEKDESKPVQWVEAKDEIYRECRSTLKTLTPGIYLVGMDSNNEVPIFIKKSLTVDTLVVNKGGMIEAVLTEIDEFWKKRETFKKVGFLHRRGYLFYGPQGSGKSCIVYLIVNDIVQRGGVVFICDSPFHFKKGLEVFRKIEPDRPLVCLFEDIDALIKRYGESEILSILDGESQTEYVLNIATTNYPELLDKRIVARPRRFDRVKKIDYPDEDVRRKFFESKLDAGEDTEKWVRISGKLSFASLAELVISVRCFGNDLEETAKFLETMQVKKVSSEELSDVGF